MSTSAETAAANRVSSYFASVDGTPRPSSETSSRVIACYSIVDRFMRACGFPDLTEGMYEGDPARPYQEAQARQAAVLLNRASCTAGKRLLDIGCGYGRILRTATERGAAAIGITVSPEQARCDRQGGLDVRLLDYRRLGHSWNASFDAVIANGSIEHFAQPEDAVAGCDDAIYRELFAIVHGLLRPDSVPGRFVTTVIHFRRRPDPADLLRPPSACARGSDAFHWSRLAHSLGGWYPVPGQLQRCARGYFELIDEEDGTEDYRLTSEAWLQGVRSKLRSPDGLGVWLRALPVVLTRPLHLLGMLRCFLGSESWNWQFRGAEPPALLLRQTWQRTSQ
jgi:cyclopropane fatty-acyl-phospholipid synthase-like methyltransferase